MPSLVTVQKNTNKDKQNEEKELVRLVREFWILDRERAMSQLTGFTKLTKASKVVNIFKKEYENILKDLAVATGPEKRKRDNVQFKNLAAILQFGEICTEEVKTQKTYMAELEQRIRDVTKNVHALKKMQITDRQYEDTCHAAVQTLETLENKLDAEMKKFNMIVTENTRMRDEITHLLWNRRNFQTLWGKLIDRLTTGKRIMLDLIEQATITYDQREDWCNKLQILRTSGHKDYVINVEEMRRYRQNIDHIVKLEKFLSIKGQKRVVKDLIQKETLKRVEMQKIMEQKMHEYKIMLTEIVEFARQTNTDVIARKYRQREADNFSSFKYVINAMNNMALANDTLGSLYESIEEQRLSLDHMAEQQTKTIENLEEQLQKSTQDTKILTDEIHQLDNKLERLMKDIHYVFKLCHCDKDPLLRLLGDQSTIKDYNVLLYLQVLENTICNNILNATYKTKCDKKFAQKRVFIEDTEPTKMHTIDQIVKNHPCALCLEHEMISDVIEKAQRVWSRAEVKERLQIRITAPDDNLTYLHTLSKCHMPQARRMQQLRYQ